MFKNNPILLNVMVTGSRPVLKNDQATGAHYLEVCAAFGQPVLPFFFPKELGVAPGVGECVQLRLELASRPNVKHFNGKPFASMDLELKVVGCKEVPESAFAEPAGIPVPPPPLATGGRPKG